MVIIPYFCPKGLDHNFHALLFRHKFLAKCNGALDLFLFISLTLKYSYCFELLLSVPLNNQLLQ